MHIFTRFFGLHVAIGRWFGNTFAPAIVIEIHEVSPVAKGRGAARATVTLRSRSGVETRIHWRGGLRCDWNSEHLARRFGEEFEAPHGTCWRLSSRLLGRHMDV